MNNIELKAKLTEILDDLDKILDAAEEGRVPLTIDDNGNPTEWENYTMSSNAQNDVYTIWMEVRRLIIAMKGVN